MTVYRLFRNEAFEPEALSTMTRTYAEVCRVLGVTDRDDGVTNVVAKTVIEFAQRGARDPILLRDCVLQALRAGEQSSGLMPSARGPDQGRAERQFGL
ncbi:MAG: hypothetical protein WCA56_03465 [Xanthobacteraceae bacterium]|jgi:hypothetical protein